MLKALVTKNEPKKTAFLFLSLIIDMTGKGSCPESEKKTIC
jgi:hypothetical protein